MTRRSFPPLLPGGPISRAEFNRLQSVVEQHDRIAGVNGITVQTTAAGVIIEDTRPQELWIKITSGTQPYAWTEQKQDAAGTFVDHVNGRSGTTTILPAYEVNGSTSVAAGTIVRAVLHPSREWYLFSTAAPAGAGSGTVTSVAMTVPTFLSVAGSPITTSGTFAVTWSGLTANAIIYASSTTDITQVALNVSTRPQYVCQSSSGAPTFQPVGQLYPTEETFTWNSQQNNLTIGPGTGAIKANVTAATTLTGIVAPSPEEPQLLWIENRPSSTNDLTIAPESGSSTAENRFGTPDGMNYTLAPGQGVPAIYDTLDNRWVLMVGNGGGGGSGTVTSVAMTVPTAEFAVAGSPITSSGTLAVTKQNQTANTVWAGPTSGGAAQPTFRLLVADDLPAAAGIISSAEFTGTTTDASVEVFTLTSVNGIIGQITVRNTGGTFQLSVEVDVTDMNNDTFNANPLVVVSVGSTEYLGMQELCELFLTGAPIKEVTISVFSTSGGNPTTYEIWYSVVT